MIEQSIPLNTVWKNAQQTIRSLIEWANSEIVEFSSKQYVTTGNIKRELLGSQNSASNQLSLDFMQVDVNQDRQNSLQSKAIENMKLTALHSTERNFTQDMEKLKAQIQIALDNLNSKDCENTALFSLIFEKVNPFVGFPAQEIDPSVEMLKELRNYSVFIELLLEQIVRELLTKLDITHANIIYGAGNLYILAEETEKNKSIIEKVRQQFNELLLTELGIRIFLKLDITEVIQDRKACVQNRAFKMKL
jgi:hypothetical protein